MSSASYPTVTASKKSIQLDPRTKLLLLLTITTLMFSTSNEGIMNLIKPLLSLVPFILILSERRFQTAGKVPDFVCGLFCAGACGPDLGERAFLLCPAGGHIHHDPLCTRYHDGRLSDCVHIGERIHWSHGADAPDGEDRDPAVGDFPLLSHRQRGVSGHPGRYEDARDTLRRKESVPNGRVPAGTAYCIRGQNSGHELSAAALTRGLGAPGRRTNLCRIGFHVQDLMAALFCVACFALFLLRPQIAFGAGVRG